MKRRFLPKLPHDTAIRRVRRWIEFFPLLLYRRAAIHAIRRGFKMPDLVNELWEVGTEFDRNELDRYFYKNEWKEF